MQVSGRSAEITVLAVDTDWFSRHGGISTFNRKLCTALVGREVAVYCATKAPSPEEYVHADRVGVRLVTGWGDARHPPRLPGGVRPDVVIGHGRVTGPAAKIMVNNHYRDAARLHVVHTAPDEVAPHKIGRDDDSGLRAEQQSALELSLARDATRVLAVGPRLHQLYLRELAVLPGVPEPLQINPGFDRSGLANRTTPPGRPRQILVPGRLDDPVVKGLDIAVSAVATALHRLRVDENEYELLLRGAPGTGHDDLRRWLLAGYERPVRMVTKSFSTDETTLRDDLLRATLMLMPSRAEAFGLAAAEAVAAGTPVLVSNRSGLGMLLRQPGLLSVEEQRRIVVPVVNVAETDVETWARAVERILAYPDAAFTTAGRVQELLAEHLTWAHAADVVLRALGRATASAGPEVRDHDRPEVGIESPPAPLAAPRTGPSTGQRPQRRFSGTARLAYQRRLGGDWRDLAAWLDLRPHEIARFDRGHEASNLWEWLQRRERLPQLPEALRAVGRSDLADLLDQSD